LVLNQEDFVKSWGISV